MLSYKILYVSRNEFSGDFLGQLRDVAENVVFFASKKKTVKAEELKQKQEQEAIQKEAKRKRLEAATEVRKQKGWEKGTMGGTRPDHYTQANEKAAKMPARRGNISKNRSYKGPSK